MNDYDKLKELAEKATPGPWELDSLESGEHGLFISQDRAESAGLGCGGNQVAFFLTEANAKYMAELTPDAVLNLLEDLRLTRQERDQEKHNILEYRLSIAALGSVLKERDEEIAALRRGQGSAPEPRGPGEGAYHRTDPIPDSTKGEQ